MPGRRPVPHESSPRIQPMRSNANGAEQRRRLISDVAAPADALTRLVAHGDQQFEAFFERVESVELLPKGAPNRVRLRKEQGLAIRKIENGRSRLAAADTISGPAFAACCDRVAGTARSIGTAPPRIRTGRWPALRLAEIEQAESRLTRAVNRRRVGFPMEITARRHRRQIQVIRSPIAAPPQFEEYFSLQAKTPWGVWGGLLPSLADEDLDPIALCLVDRLRSRGLPPHRGGAGVIVLGPNAAAVLLHEVVAHALEADTLALSGAPDQAVGLKLGGPELDVVDDPSSAPRVCKRSSDDEGTAVISRWLLRRGRVRQPLADLAWAERCPGMIPGAARRASRHRLPGPRTSHLELLPGAIPEGDLFAEAAGGIYIGEFDSGSLDPLNGRCVLRAPCGRRIGASGPVDHTGPIEIRSRAADLLAAVTAVADRPLAAGAGWCAKDGALMPVWARCPSIRLEGLQVAD